MRLIGINDFHGHLDSSLTLTLADPGAAGRTGHLVVGTVADVLDPDTRTAKVRIAYSNRDGRLRPAMFATVSLRTWDTKELTVAPTALVLSGDKTTVFVQISPNTFEQRRVGTGEQIGQRTVIRDGLQIGDKVLIREGALLQ